MGHSESLVFGNSKRAISSKCNFSEHFAKSHLPGERNVNGDNKSKETSLFTFYFINAFDELASPRGFPFESKSILSCTCTCARGPIYLVAFALKYRAQTRLETRVLHMSSTVRARKLNALPEHWASLVTCASLLSFLCTAFTMDKFQVCEAVCQPQDSLPEHVHEWCMFYCKYFEFLFWRQWLFVALLNRAQRMWFVMCCEEYSQMYALFFYVPNFFV